jgi:hypothetical protein
MRSNFLNYLALALVLTALITLGACAKAEVVQKPLAVGDTFKLGAITVEVIRLDESTAPQVVWSHLQSGMKFVMVELDYKEIPSGGDFDSRLIFLESSSGKQYGPPTGYYVVQSSDGKQIWEFEWCTYFLLGPSNFGGYEDEVGISAAGDLNLLFQVDQNESLDTLIKLGYEE